MARFRLVSHLGLCFIPYFALLILSAALSFSPAHAQTSEPAVVRAVMFWMEGCPHCDEVIKNVLPSLQGKYGAQLKIELVEVVSLEDVNRLYALGAAYGISREQSGVPLLIIGSHVLIGADQIPAELPLLIEDYLTLGGVALPDIATYYNTIAAEAEPVGRPDGSWLAMGVMGFILIALIYRLAAVLWKKLPAPPERWAQLATPLLALIGLGVAGYLAYVEIRAVEAVCGPLGDCNAVQASSYTLLFGILPVGVVGVIGYLLILAAWGWNYLRRDYLPGLASGALSGMTLLGTLFSIYLTYLELYVIHTVCLWCLASAVIITLLMLLTLSPARYVLNKVPHAQSEILIG